MVNLGMAMEGDTPDEGLTTCSCCGEEVYDIGDGICPECGETLWACADE